MNDPILAFPDVGVDQLKTAFLRQRQSLPLHLQIEMSVRRIRQWREYWLNQGRDVYVSLGGKDSHALLHLVRTVYPDVPGVFVDTGMEYPEVRELNLRTPNVTVVKPRISFAKVIEKYGWPMVSKKVAQYIHETREKTGRNDQTRHLRLTGERNMGRCAECDTQMHRSDDGKWMECRKCGSRRMVSHMSMIPKKWRYLAQAPFKISHKCCKVLKIEPLTRYVKETGRVAYIGTTAAESRTREKNYLQNGCNAYHIGDPKSTPIIFWTEQSVLQYLRENDIEVAACYGEQIQVEPGVWQYSKLNRTGCMFCGFGAHLEETPNRFLQMEYSYPDIYHHFMYRMGMREVLEYCGIEWRNGEQMELFG